MKLKHWTDQLARGDVTPEHTLRRPSPDGHHHPDLDCAFAYVKAVNGTSDYVDEQAWHGWALREAVLAGISLERARQELAPVFDNLMAAIGADETGLIADHVNALLLRHHAASGARQPLVASHVESLLKQAGVVWDRFGGSARWVRVPLNATQDQINAAVSALYKGDSA